MLQVKTDDVNLMPVRFNEYDAGLDLRAKQSYRLYVGERTLVGTGISIAIPEGTVGLLFPRSSLSKKGISVTNSVGVIDSGYRGEVIASLYFSRFHSDHLSLGYQTIDKYERIVQLVIMPIFLYEPIRYIGPDEEWFDTDRGEGGFGSTGK